MAIRFYRRVTTCALLGAMALPCMADPMADAAAAYEAGNYAQSVRLYDAALADDPRLRDDPAYIAARRTAESAHIYAVGLRLHREGEYEAAIEQFVLAVGKDNENTAALAALSDAQFAAARVRFDAAIAAADAGDLLAARGHLEQARDMGGNNLSIGEALAGIEQPEEVFKSEQIEQYARAKELAEDRQWGLAARQYAELVDAEPLMLIARAGLHQSRYFQQRSIELAEQGEEHLSDERLGPAVEALSGAVAIWPYHPRAGKLLEEVQLRITKARELADRARAELERGEFAKAYETAQAARAQDLSSGPAQDVLRDATRMYSNDLAAQGDAQIEAEDYAAARAFFAQAFEVSRGSKAAREGMTRYHLKLAELATTNEHEGLALLHLMATGEYGIERPEGQVAGTERSLLREADATYRLRVSDRNPQIGVNAGELARAIATRDSDPWLSAAVGEERARYHIDIRITATDVVLRQIDSLPVDYTFGGGTTGFSGWEKRGFIDCDILISNPATGDEIDRWQANRWNAFSDRQQYVVGQTLRDSYWTLPTDDEVEARLSRDMARELWPHIRAAITRQRAEELAAQSKELSQAGEAAAALESQVAAVVLLGQLDRREALARLRDLMREHTHPAGPAAD